MSRIYDGNVVKLQDGAAATGPSTAYQVGNSPKVYGVDISDTAEVALQGSFDGVTWFDIATFTASGLHTFDSPWPHLRDNITSYTGGTVNSWLSV